MNGETYERHNSAEYLAFLHKGSSDRNAQGRQNTRPHLLES